MKGRETVPADGVLRGGTLPTHGVLPGTQKNKPTVFFRGTRKYRYYRKFNECYQIMYTGFTHLQRFGKRVKKLHTTNFCKILHCCILSLAVRMMYCGNKTLPVPLKSFQNNLEKKHH